ncbi:MAG: exodeoxyribonuclease III [Anaerolineales bacterium]|nr:exodeoxyribonuclease III [Anaerolineales bacterium]
MKIATFNCNSVRMRIDQIVRWLKRERPDILCLQETKVQDSDFPQAAFDKAGYYVVFRGQKAYAGVAVVSREETSDILFGIDDGGEPDEARLIQLRAAGVTVINTYVPQGRSADSEHFAYKLEWLARFHRLLERRFAPNDRLVWCGDLNVAPEPIDLHDPKANKDHVDFHPLAREALENVRAWGLADVFRRLHPDEPGHYTFWDYRVANAVKRNIGWRVDHIWATEPVALRAAKAWIDVKARKVKRPSDHTFLVAEFAD